jgi:sugar phosphate isomerase/epimerase
VHQRLSVSAVSSWRWTLDEDLAFWAETGVDHVGLSFRKLEEHGLEPAVARVGDAGLRVSNIVELGWWDLAEPAGWPAQQQRLARAVDVATDVGGCLVLTTGPARGLDWDDAAARLADALGPVREHAAAGGVELTIEHTGPLRLDLSFCTTFLDGVELARRCATGLCMEVSSCFAERDLAARITAAHDVLAHVQLSDFVIGSLCTPDRAVPGDGDVPLGAIVGAINTAGYAGAFELELVGPRIEEEGYRSAVTRSIEHLDALLAARLGQRA